MKKLIAVLALALVAGLIGASPGAGSTSNSSSDLAQRGGAVLDVGAYHVCVILADGTPTCWGDNGAGELGIGDTERRGGDPADMGANLPMIDLGEGRHAVSISAGGDQTCAILDDATVKCWGSGFGGQLGQDSTDRIGNGIGASVADTPPIDLGPGRSAIQVVAARSFTCALLDDGGVKCWGANSNGQLGQDSTDRIGDGIGASVADTPAIDLGRPATAISSGSGHTCAILDDGTVKCWGDGGSGQLGQDNADDIGTGLGTAMADLAPIDLGVGRTATAISVGDNHSCALLDDASIKCWGDNNDGQLGQNSSDNAGDGVGTAMADLAPVDLGAGRSAKAVSAGYDHTCALLTDDTVVCWGENQYGQLGQEDQVDIGDGVGPDVADTPAIDFGADRTVLAIGTDGTSGDGLTCVLFDDETVTCFGNNESEQVGLGKDRNDFTGWGRLPGQMGDDLLTVDLDGRVRPIQIECPTSPDHGFPDVVSSWAQAPVACIKELGITNGTGGGATYSPADNVTREQMAAFMARVWRSLDQTCPTTPFHGFPDVPAGSFANADITCIKELGITNGTGGGATYSPADNVTREQMAAFLGRLWRALGNTCPTTPEHGFTDVPASSYANADITCLKALGITTGTGGGTTFSPYDNVTREQMAAFLARLIDANADVTNH